MVYCSEYAHAYYMKNRERLLKMERARKLRSRYGMTEDDYKQMIVDQNNLCSICAVDFSKVDKIHIDHCHTTNKVRGLLCVNCNSGIGIFRDDIEVLEKAIKYLEKHR